MASIHYPGEPGTLITGGRAAALPPGPGALLATLTLQNTSGAEQAAGFVSPMFGQPFRQGDVPAGQYPQFALADDTPVPATIHSATSWPDGSMKWCGVMMRVPAPVAGSGTLAISVKNGGSAPAASNRALGDFAAAAVSVELTGVTNLSGAWASTLADAIASGQAVRIGDGPAGAIWRVLGDFKQAGTAHGQLVCWHYVAALQNAAGGLLGVRYLGRVAQPWVDVVTPAPTRRVVSAALKSGGGTLRTLQGHDTTESVGANIGMPHYTSFFTAGVDGRWDFVQGGGSASADCTVRVQLDKTYVVGSGLVPSYSTTTTATSNASVDYVPYCKGLMEMRDTGATGPRAEIGVVPRWAVRHLMTQKEVDERAVRVTGLASGGWRTCLRKQATKQVIACTDPSPSYAGLGAIQKAWRYYPGSEVAGVSSPVVDASIWSGEMEPSHRGACAYYPYLITGEPQYLDLLVEHAAGVLLHTATGGSAMRTAAPITASTLRIGDAFGARDVTIGSTTYKGGGFLFLADLQRIPAWGTRDVAEAGAIYPDVCPSGTEARKYFRDVMEANYAAAQAYIAARPAEWQASGLWSFKADAGAGHSPWNAGYLSHSVCHQASILASGGAAAFRLYLSKFWQNIAAHMDVAAAGAYNAQIYDESATRVESFSQVLFELAYCTLTFSTETSRATVSGINGDWTPTNGDRIAFWDYVDPDKPFAAAVEHKTFYMVNCSGGTFQLSATKGGAPITVTSGVTVTGFYAALENFAPNFSFQGDNKSTDAYMVDNLGAVNHHLACGDINVAAAQAAMQAKVAAMGVSYAQDPSNAFAASFTE